MSSETARVALRMRDVGFSLRAAQAYGQLLNRIRLQKFIYLLDAVSILYESFPASDGHVTYKAGPYDVAIQNAVDALLFRGLVMANATRATASGEVGTNYSLSGAGQAWCERISSQSEFSERWQTTVDIAAKIELLAWSRLRELVYAEPTFVAARGAGLGKRLSSAAPAESSTSTLLYFIRSSLQHTMPSGVVPTRKLLVDLLFRYLDEYAVRSARTRA